MGKRLILITVAVMTMLCCGIYAISSSRPVAQSVIVTPGTGPPYETIRLEMERMTEAQFKNYARELKGKQVTWTGWVEDVNEKAFGGYELWVDMDPPDKAFSVQDVTFDVPDELALKFQKDQVVSFSGTVTLVMDVIGSTQVSLSNVSVEE